MKRRLGPKRTVLCPRKTLPHPQGRALPQNPVSLPLRQLPPSCNSDHFEFSSSAPRPSRTRLSYSRALTALRSGKRVCWAFSGLLPFLNNTTWDPCYLVPTPDSHNARYGASECQPVQTPICTSAGTVPHQGSGCRDTGSQLRGQPSHLKLVANSPEPRQGFVFAKTVLGARPVWVCTSLPTPRLHSCQGSCALLLWQ